jgi:hypothetical protein
MATLEACLENADELASRVVDGWARNTIAGNGADITPEYRALFEKANSYRTAKGVAEDHRRFNGLSEAEAAEERETRQAFAQAYKIFADRHETAA